MAPRVIMLDDGKSGSCSEAGLEAGSAASVPTTSLYRKRISELLRVGASQREMYQAGLEDGRQPEFVNLTDILFFLRDRRLGRMSVIQESNSHVIFKVYDCVCCELGTEQNCHYMAGFLAGALRANGRPETVKVREVSCGGGPGCDCVFEANW